MVIVAVDQFELRLNLADSFSRKPSTAIFKDEMRGGRTDATSPTMLSLLLRLTKNAR